MRGSLLHAWSLPCIGEEGVRPAQGRRIQVRCVRRVRCCWCRCVHRCPLLRAALPEGAYAAARACVRAPGRVGVHAGEWTDKRECCTHVRAHTSCAGGSVHGVDWLRLWHTIDKDHRCTRLRTRLCACMSIHARPQRHTRAQRAEELCQEAAAHPAAGILGCRGRPTSIGP